MNNISAILKSAGYEFSDVVKSTILLKNIEDFKTVNDIYAECYPENQPARAAYAVKDLPLGALVEVETIAVK
jgi:2-iminobutanoate/2-iminopropanoate deaminase